jgi:rRNA maturation endonuclease Nob1
MTKEEKLIEELKRLIQKYDCDTSYADEFTRNYVQIPTIELEPIRRGKWIERWFGYGYKVRCSKCGCLDDKRTDYCPHCGAKMEVEE